ncbi:flagellar hook-associated protein FlgK [Parendozoicomonas haliclonae]|uniref:Flagellar hook-associated protein 1 n=1 Tax=Parendozoicomonas haliclonae TaxID=1960125 RepID=A0A1X7AGX9_9GAMM|nr:flagellar hook-associated protein FlgK [Parendozoicomonas haliclonae]SMA39747.1 Flagellar hook-associated protein 1 [Parendozoicomonas haliclonae]
MSLSDIGISGMLTAQKQLTVTSNNIANVNTIGYSRQEVLLSAIATTSPGQASTGNGVVVTDVRRLADSFLIGQLRDSVTLYNEKMVSSQYMTQMDSYLGNESSIITAGLDQFFAAANAASVDPASLPARQQLISEAIALSQRFNTVQDQLDSQSRLLTIQLDTATAQANSYIESIAGFNQQIQAALSNGSNPNDLMDQREQAIQELATLTGLNVLPQPDGMVNVYLTSGYPLVLGSQTNTLSVGQHPVDPNLAGIYLNTSASTIPLTANLGGTIGGLQSYQSDILPQVQNEIGRLAIIFSDNVNSLLAGGYDLDGHQGEPTSQLMNDVNWLSSVDRIKPDINNTGDARLSLDVLDMAALKPGGNYTLTVTGGNYDITDDTGASVATGLVADINTAGFDGLGLTLHGGTLADGDVYELNFPISGIPAADRVLATNGNDTLLLAVDDSSMLQASNYVLTVNGGNYQIARQSDGLVVSNGAVPAAGSAPIEFDGLKLSLNEGTLEDGEVYLLQPARRAADEIGVAVENARSLAFASEAGSLGDNTQLQALVDLQNAELVSDGVINGQVVDGGVSLGEGYTRLVGRMAVMTSQVNTELQTSQSLYEQARDARDGYSGVNLDEEAMMLVRAEQAYAASAQVISVAQSTFDTLLRMF